MSFKSCDPGIVFELRLSESSARECLRSPPTRASVCECMEGVGNVCVCVWGGGVDLVFPKFTSCKLFWDYYSGVKNRWNPFKVEWKDGVLWNRGRFSNTAKVKIKEMNLQTQNEQKLVFVGRTFISLSRNFFYFAELRMDGDFFVYVHVVAGSHRRVQAEWYYCD